jgi:hypothetical protein
LEKRICTALERKLHERKKTQTDKALTSFFLRDQDAKKDGVCDAGSVGSVTLGSNSRSRTKAGIRVRRYG